MREGKLSRRAFLRWSAASVAVTTIAGCAPKQAAPAPTSEPVEQATAQPAVVVATAVPEAPAPAMATGQTVYLWYMWGAETDKGVNKITESEGFKEVFGDNKLEVKSRITDDVLLTAVSAGTPPDGASCVPYLDYMARGVLAPIDEWVATSSIFQKEYYFPGYWDGASYRGTMYAVPCWDGFVRYALFYNADLVEAAGLDPDTPPQTWSECMVWHKALTKFDAAKNLTQVGLDPYDAMGGALNIQDGFFAPMSWGWKWFDAEAGKFDFSNDKFAASLDVMGEFIRIAGPDNLGAMRKVKGQGAWGEAYDGAKVQAMIIDGFWLPIWDAKTYPELKSVATWVPVADERRGVKLQGTGGHYVILFKDAKNAHLMFKIAEFFNTPPALDVLYKESIFLPGRLDFLKSLDVSDNPPLEFFFKSIDEATEWYSPLRCPITSFVETQYTELKEAVYRDQMKASEAAAEMQKRCVEEFAAAGFAQ